MTDPAGREVEDQATGPADREAEDLVKAGPEPDPVQGLKPGPEQDLQLEKQTMSTLIVRVTFTGGQVPAGSNAIRKAGHSKGQAAQPTAHVRLNKEDPLTWTVNIRQDREVRQEPITIRDHGVAAAVEDQEVQHPAVVAAPEEVAVAVVVDDEEAEVAAEDADTRNKITRKVALPLARLLSRVIFVLIIKKA